jgi:hypothetical protein
VLIVKTAKSEHGMILIAGSFHNWPRTKEKGTFYFSLREGEK